MKAHTHPLSGSQAETPSFLWPKNGIFRQILKYGFTEKGREFSEKWKIKSCYKTKIDFFQINDYVCSTLLGILSLSTTSELRLVEYRLKSDEKLYGRGRVPRILLLFAHREGQILKGNWNNWQIISGLAIIDYLPNLAVHLWYCIKTISVDYR